MSDINKIIKINSAINALQSTDPDLRMLDISTLDDKVGSIADSSEIRKVAQAQQYAAATLGTTLDLGSVTRIADCIKNIDDLLLEKIKQKAIQELLKNKGASNISEKVAKLRDMAILANQLYVRAKQIEDMSLLELLLLAKNSGAFQQSQIFKTIQEKYGAIVGNINDMLANIANLDICSMVNYKTGNANAVPGSLNITNSAPTALPSFAPPMTIDTTTIDVKNQYEDVLKRIGEIIVNSENIAETPPNKSAVTELQILARTVVNAYCESADESVDDDIQAQFMMQINKTIETKGKEWPDETKGVYSSRAQAIVYIAFKDANILRTYTQLKNKGSLVNGQRVATGVTIYGGPDWDFTTFLDIMPSQRPKELTDYWTNRGYDIAAQETKLNGRGIKTGTLNLADAYKGAYGRQLRAGFSCASTRFPGGSQLQLKNPDGTIYDPAGLNPSGIVVVDDTGNAELTYKKVDLFISREHVDAYKQTNMSAVEVILISSGTQRGPQYTRAQKKFGATSLA